MRGQNLNLAFGTEVIYDDAEFYIGDNDKTGIVGVNGAGKTTLFRVLLGEQPLDGGKIHIGSARLGYLPQEIGFADKQKTVWDYLFDARPVRETEARLSELYDELAIADESQHDELLREVSILQSRLDEYDAYNAENTLLELIYDMSIENELLGMKLGELSGGQKSKIAFAHVLFSNPQILLLDEPTNHLDASTKDFVTSYLKSYKGSVLIISHDAEFLNAVVNKILFVNKVTHKTDNSARTRDQEIIRLCTTRASSVAHQP